MVETHRRLYNAALEQRVLAYTTRGISLSYYTQCADLKDLRKDDPYQGRANHCSQQATLRRLDKAYQSFFRRCKKVGKPGFPRFKNKYSFDSIEYPIYNNGIILNGSKLKVWHIGIIKTKVHRPTEGRIKTAIIKQEADKWYVILTCDLGNIKATQSTFPPGSIDLGIENFLTTSDDHKIANPRFYKEELPKLRRLQQFVSRTKRGSNNRKKAQKKVKILHIKIKNKRLDHHHKTALFILRLYGLIGVESLAIANMVKNHSLARAIQDAGWANFVNNLSYKAKRFGAKIVMVDPKGTSQECSGCGITVTKKLSQRIHNCPDCGLSIHRDLNAARNILGRALQVRAEPADAKGNPAFVREAV